MLNQMRKARFLELILLVVFSSLLATVDGSLSSVLDLKLQPERPNNLYYSLRGSTFVLNCTVIVGNYTQPLKLTWQHNKKWLFGEVQYIDTATVQLTLSSTSSKNNGIYWCGPKLGHMSQGVNISLIVADPPSSPRNLRYSVVGAIDIDREYRVFWTASSITGGLPVNYSVKLCVNDSYAVNNGVCNWSSNPGCRPTNVLSKDRDFSCVLRQSGDFVSPCEKKCNYTLSVVAENAVGSVASWQYLPHIPLYSATPLPPLSFNVVATDKQKALKVSWTPQPSWRTIQVEFTILYHARNEKENKTKVIYIVRSFAQFTLLKQLKSFVEYYVYLAVRFVNYDGKKSASSRAEGPHIVKTPAGEPDAPPKVIKDWSTIFPGNPALRNVTVEWKLSRNSSWHGTPGKHVVFCRYHHVNQGSPPDCEYHVDATSNRTVLQRLDSAKSYNVYIRICNKEHFCSSGGHKPYVVKELEDNSTSPSGGKLSSKQIALITVSVVVASITALVAVYLLRQWLHRRGVSPRVPLRNLLTLQPPLPPYNYMDPPATNDYDQLNLNENQL